MKMNTNFRETEYFLFLLTYLENSKDNEMTVSQDQMKSLDRECEQGEKFLFCTQVLDDDGDNDDDILPRADDRRW